MKAIVIKSRGSNVRGVPTTKKKQLEQMLDIAAQSGVPAAQRDPDMMATLKVPQIGAAPRTADKTVRRLTRVERLLRSGVIEQHEAQACEWYAEQVALAWDTTGCTANYEGGSGGGGSAHAPDRLMAKRQDIAWARDDAREVRAMLGGTMADAFEAIVCRNEALGPTAAAAFPDLQRSAAGERMRLTLKFCAGKIHERFARQMSWIDAPVIAVQARRTAALAAVPTRAPLSAEAPMMQLIAAAVAARAGQASEVWIAEAAYQQVSREAGRTVVQEIAGAPIRIRDQWRWGWVIVDAAIAA